MIYLRDLSSKYLFTVMFIVFIVLSYILVKPYIVPLLSSSIIAYVLYPLYRRANNKIKNKNLTSLLFVIIALFIIFIPIFFLTGILLDQAARFYFGSRDIEIAKVSEFLSGIFGENVDIEFYFRDIINRGIEFIGELSANLIFSLPKLIISLFIIFFVLFFLFREGDAFIYKFKKIMPLNEEQKNILVKRINEVFYAVIYGIITVSIIHGTIGMIGLYLFDIPSPIFWGFIMMILTMLPMVGAWLIWVPAALFKFYSGETFNGIGLLIFGAVLIGILDNIIGPKIISKRAKIHPVLVILGVFGGLKWFGLIGIVIGPLILAISMVFLKWFIESNETKS